MGVLVQTGKVGIYMKVVGIVLERRKAGGIYFPAAPSQRHPAAALISRQGEGRSRREEHEECRSPLRQLTLAQRVQLEPAAGQPSQISTLTGKDRNTAVHVT